MSSIRFNREIDSKLFGMYSKSPKSEKVGEYVCSVYRVENILYNSRARTEHLNNNKNVKLTKNINEDQMQTAVDELSNFSMYNDFEERQDNDTVSNSYSEPKYEDYFDIDKNISSFLGRRIAQTEKTHKLSAKVWLAPTKGKKEAIFPLKIEQLMPVLEVAQISSDQLAKKLKEFFTLKMPEGFPVQVVIPLYNLVYVHFTFENLRFVKLHDDEFRIRNESEYKEGIIFKALSSSE